MLTIISGCAAAETNDKKKANSSAGLGIAHTDSIMFATMTMTQTTAQVCFLVPVRSAIVPKNRDAMTLIALPAVGIVLTSAVE